MDIILTGLAGIVIVGLCVIALSRMDWAEAEGRVDRSRAASVASSRAGSSGCLWTLALLGTLALVWLFWLLPFLARGVVEGCSFFGAPDAVRACERGQSVWWNLVTVHFWITLAAFLPALAATTSWKAAGLVCLLATAALAAFAVWPSAVGSTPMLMFAVLLAESAWLLLRRLPPHGSQSSGIPNDR